MLAAALHRAVSLALPPRCPGCGVPVGEDHRFCAACWRGLRFVGPPWCAACNTPFAYDRGDKTWCAACLADPPRHAGVRAAVAYGAVARRLALRLKYGRRTGLATTMARSMARHLPANADLLVPVPLHRWRLWARGYNQAALIATSLGRVTGLPVERYALIRTRRTVPLRGMGPRERSRTVRGAFAVTTAEAIRGRSVVLVDDVYTSGATADACTRMLLRCRRRSRDDPVLGRGCCPATTEPRRRIDKPPPRSHLPSMAKIEIYTKAFCPYCSRALSMLAAKGVVPEEYDITMGGPKRVEMIDRASGRTTVPQIFVDGRHVGGFDDMAALDRQGKLDPLLAA